MTRLRSDKLKQVHAVRELQRRAREIEAHRADAEVAARDARYVALRQEQSDSCVQWSAAVSSGRLDLVMSRAWAASILVQEGQVKVASGELEAARRDAIAKRQDYWLASGRAEAIDELVSKALRRERLQADERALLEASDRTTQQW